nr:TspO/MBR family protein [Altericroceibacterium xinjiangense]
MSPTASSSSRSGRFLRWALILVPAVVLLGLGSGALSGSAAENPWFSALQKPALYPPPATFGIVWSILYVMMGIALALVCAADDGRWRKPAIGVFLVQLVLNLAWSPVFFALHRIADAMILLLVIDVAVIATVVLFWRVRPLAGALLLPYLAWVLFATVLNWQFLQLNPAQLASGA